MRKKRIIWSVLMWFICAACLVIAALLAALLFRMDFRRCLTIVNFGSIASCIASLLVFALDRWGWK